MKNKLLDIFTDEDIEFNRMMIERGQKTINHNCWICKREILKEYIQNVIKELEEWSDDVEIILPSGKETIKRKVICTKNAIDILKSGVWSIDD